MSASTMVEPFDMPMIDYNEDRDIPMAGSSTENWFQPLSHMDEDVDPSDPQEVDMMAYEETTTEYEMEDDAAQAQETTLDSNVSDAEVYDVTIHSSPLPPATTEIAENYDPHPRNSEAAGVVSLTQPPVDEGSHLTMTHDSDSEATQHFAAPDAAQSHDALSVASDARHSDYVTAPEVLEHGHEHQRDEPEGSPLVSLRPSKEVTNAVEGHSSTLSEKPARVSRSEGSEKHPDDERLNEHPDPHADGLSALAYVSEEMSASEHPEGKESSRGLSTEREGTVDVVDEAIEQPEPHANQQAYIQPPPPIFLALQVTSSEGDQPDFVLFNSPELGSHTSEEPLVLLQHHPSLFYEPISAVFEAFRQEEYFSHLEELSEAEMALNAHELQLVISEDNIYAREVSLHDLHAMHQGVGLPGHLRLTLQSVVPRFIARYNVLRDQITRLVLTDESEEAQHYTVNVGDEEEEHETQAPPKLIVSQQDLERETRSLQAIEETEDAEGADQSREDDDQRQSEDDSDETEEDRNQVGQNATLVASEHVDVERDERATLDSDDDDFEEYDDTAGDLDADAVHANAPKDGAEPTPEEYATEYTDVAELREEGEEGYDDDFKGDGADGTGTAGDVGLSGAPTDDSRSEAYANEEQQYPVPTPDDAQPQAVSHSTSTSSFDTDDSTWEGEVEEVDASPDLKQETDHSTQQATANVFDEEGNFTDGVEGGDDDFRDDDFVDGDFGDDDLDDSAEGTLEDLTEDTEELAGNGHPSEELEKDDDAASQAVLAESEKFVSDLDKGGDSLAIAIEEAVNVKNTKSQSLETRSSNHNIAVETASEKPKAVHKNPSKRSLDDAKLDDEKFISPPSSPDSKRTRTL